MITVQFKDFDDMMAFAKRMCGVTTIATKTEPQVQPAESIPAQPATPAATPPVRPLMAPVPTVPQPVPAPAVPPQPQVQAPVQQSVPTSAVTYTLDELARAAMPLMDSGKQPDLLQLLASFGVEALPALPPAQYGAFATALRGLGAQI